MTMVDSGLPSFKPKPFSVFCQAGRWRVNETVQRWMFLVEELRCQRLNQSQYLNNTLPGEK